MRNEELTDDCEYTIVNDINAPVKDYYWADQKNIINQKECRAKLEQIRNPD